MKLRITKDHIAEAITFLIFLFVLGFLAGLVLNFNDSDEAVRQKLESLDETAK